MKRWYALLTVAIVAAAGAIAWSKPWETGVVSVTKLARKAFGGQPVVHVLARSATDRRPAAADDGIEIWYRRRRPSHIVERRAGRVTLDAVRDQVEPLSVPPIASVPAPLWDFVTSYRPDLADGQLRVLSRNSVEGRAVVWIGADDFAVAIDPTSYQPLWVSDARPPFGTELIHLVTAETIPYDAADFVLLKQRKPRHL